MIPNGFYAFPDHPTWEGKHQVWLAWNGLRYLYGGGGDDRAAQGFGAEARHYTQQLSNEWLPHIAAIPQGADWRTVQGSPLPDPRDPANWGDRSLTLVDSIPAQFDALLGTYVIPSFAQLGSGEWAGGVNPVTGRDVEVSTAGHVSTQAGVDPATHQHVASPMTAAEESFFLDRLPRPLLWAGAAVGLYYLLR